METKIFKDHEEQSAAAAGYMLEVIRNKPTALCCFATGDSPKRAYEIFVAEAKRQGIDTSHCFMIGLDEWMGIPTDNPGSCHRFLHDYLFIPLQLRKDQYHLFNAFPQDADKECETMNEVIAAHGGIDLMVVGVGLNGHIGFNEPGTPLSIRAHASELETITKSTGQKYFPAKVEIGKGLTVGLLQVLESRTLLMLANGAKKAPVIHRAVNEPISNSFPATLMRQHQNSYLIIDQEAAASI